MSPPVTSKNNEGDALKRRDDLQTKLQEAIRNYAPASEVKELERKLKAVAEELNASDKPHRPDPGK